MSRMCAKILLAAAFALLCSQAMASLMAVDLGGNFLKVAVVQPGRKPISIAINEMSRRQTPVLVGFVDGQRVLGEEAVTVSGRHPSKFIGHLRDLVGRRADDPVIAMLLKDNLLGYDIVPDDERGTVRIRIPDFDRTFSIEELVASELSYAHQIASLNAGTTDLPAAILIPPHFGPHQRQALLDAAEIASLPVVTLSQSHAAAALQYGIERDFTNRTESIILYDVASSDVVAALVEYSAYKSPGTPKHLSQFVVQDVAWDTSSGASQIDALLARHFADEFASKHSTGDILESDKVAAKMRKAVRRTKEMLSANEDAPFHVEELYNGIDFSTTITRKTLEELSAPYWQTVKAPLATLIERNNLTDTSANITVQLLGGASRMPRVRAELTSVHSSVQLERQLDASEAFASGGGLVAANMSTTFRLRRFGMHDGNTFPVTLTLGGVGIPRELSRFTAEEGGRELFPYMHRLDSKRRVVFTDVTSDPFTLSLSYAGDRIPCCLPADGKLATYTVTGVKELLAKYNDTEKVLAHFELDANGMVELSAVELQRVFNVTETVKKVVLDPEADAKADANATDAEKENATNTTAPKVPATKIIDVPKEVTRKVALPLTVSVERHGIPALSEASKKASRELLGEFAKREEQKRETEKARNDFESYIVNTRAKLEDDDAIIQVTTELQRGSFRAELTDAEDWLYMDPGADKASAATFAEKLKSLTAIGDPIKTRAYEAQRRPERMQGAKQLVQVAKMSVNVWPETKPFLNATHISKLGDLVKEFEEWLNEMESAQGAKAPHEDPAYTVAQLQDRFEVVSTVFTNLNKKQAPRPPPTAPSNTTNTTTNAGNESATGTDRTHQQQGGEEETNIEPDADAPHEEL